MLEAFFNAWDDFWHFKCFLDFYCLLTFESFLTLQTFSLSLFSALWVFDAQNSVTFQTFVNFPRSEFFGTILWTPKPQEDPNVWWWGFRFGSDWFFLPPFKLLNLGDPVLLGPKRVLHQYGHEKKTWGSSRLSAEVRVFIYKSESILPKTFICKWF